MSVEQKVFCDRCRCVVVESRTLLTVAAGALRDRLPSIDLCASCLDQLQSWLKTGQIELTEATA